MLHELLLSLSGHPSPFLRANASANASDDDNNNNQQPFPGITPPERRLLSSAAHLSDVHIKLIAHTAQIAESHPSIICRAVAGAIRSIHLAAFRKKILDVEESILKNDPDLVGAYHIVPLTAVVGEFRPWVRRMEWLWDLVQFMSRTDEQGGSRCHGSGLIDKLRTELQSGYQDVMEVAGSLVVVAELAWLKQVSAWILYGKLPGFGADDFFVHRVEASEQVRFGAELLGGCLANMRLGLHLCASTVTVFCHASDCLLHALHW